MKHKMEWLALLLQTTDKAMQRQLNALRVPQHLVKSWFIPSELVASSRLLALSADQMVDPRCLEDVINGRALTAITELRAASVLQAQFQAQLGRFETTLDDDLSSLTKAKKTAQRTILLFRIRRKEILRDLVVAMQERQECLYSLIKHPLEISSSAVCREIVEGISVECKGYSKSVGASLMSTRRVRLLGRSAADTKWALRLRRLGRQCGTSNSTECSTWRSRVDGELRRVQEHIQSVCGGMLVHAPHDVNTKGLMHSCKVYKDKPLLNVATT